MHVHEDIFYSTKCSIATATFIKQTSSFHKHDAWPLPQVVGYQRKENMKEKAVAVQ